MIHHITYEVDKRLLSQELDLWSILGFNPTGLRRRTRKQPPIHWLVCGDENTAVELLPVDKRPHQGLGHVSFTLDLRRWQIVTIGLERLTWMWAEDASDYFGNKRMFLHSPSGYKVELILGNPPIKAGPPLEEESDAR